MHSSFFLPAATARWSINAVSPTSPQRNIEHGGIETNELNMTLMSHKYLLHKQVELFTGVTVLV